VQARQAEQRARRHGGDRLGQGIAAQQTQNDQSAQAEDPHDPHLAARFPCNPACSGYRAVIGRW
jgi:hypothetical protein